FQLVKTGNDPRSRACRYKVIELGTQSIETILPTRFGEAQGRLNPLVYTPSDERRSQIVWERLSARGLGVDDLEDYGGQLWEACHTLWLACGNFRCVSDKALIRLAESSGIFPRLFPSDEEEARTYDLFDRLDDINY